MSRDNDNDTVIVEVNDGTRHQQVGKTLSEFKDYMADMENGMAEVIIDDEIDLTDAGATYVKIATIPINSVITYVAMKILTTVDDVATSGGNLAKVGIGTHGADVDQFCITADLVAGTKAARCNQVALAAAQDLDVSGVTTAGAAANSNLLSGLVRVVIRYLVPNVLT